MVLDGLRNLPLVLVAEAVSLGSSAFVGGGVVGPKGIQLTLDGPPFSQDSLSELLVRHETPIW